jgi:predicted Fe-S protein YdhL (DUF1289 family)
MNKSIEKAINLTQRLRAVMLQMVALEKEWDDYENSEEYMQSLVSDFTEGWNRSDDAAAAWGKMSEKERQAYFKKVEKLNRKTRKKRLKKPATKSARSLKEQDATEESTAILAQIDQLLYALMNMGGDEGWNDEADYEERTQLKLGEALKDRMILAKAIKI